MAEYTPALVQPFIALTDKAWFDFLASRSRRGLVDEVNFWSPRAVRPMKHMDAGELIFFRLKKQYQVIAGYGFFASFHVLDLDTAWELFGWKNGDPDKLRFLQRIGTYRSVDLLDPRAPREPIGCHLLRNAVFWEERRWLPWGADRGWASNIVQGKTETDAARIDLLLHEVGADAPEEFEATGLVVVEGHEPRVAVHGCGSRGVARRPHGPLSLQSHRSGIRRRVRGNGRTVARAGVPSEGMGVNGSLLPHCLFPVSCPLFPVGVSRT